MGFQSARVGRLCIWDRSSAGGLTVRFAGVRFFYGTDGAMLTEIGIPFAGVQVLHGGASGVASEVWVHSAGVGPTLCVTGCTTNISGMLVLLHVRQSPSSFMMSDAQEHHLSEKTWYNDRWNMY